MSRADAELNRARILAAALDALKQDPAASLNQIAKRAGVGIGTLYRHFPTREALLVTIYQKELQTLVDAAPKLLESKPPFDALRLWLDRFAAQGRAKQGLVSALENPNTHDRITAESYGPIIGALTMLLEANETAGTIRKGIDPDDVLLMLGFLWRVDPVSGAPQAKRMLTIVLDGLRAGSS